jgi:hypothetical protein
MPGSGLRRHDAGQRLIAPTACRETSLPASHHYCPGASKAACDADDDAKIAPSTAAATNFLPRSAIRRRLPRPAQPQPKTLPRQISIDARLLTQPPRVPSWEAFGSRPSVRLARSRSAGIRNPAPFQTFGLAHELITPASDLPAWLAWIAALMRQSLRQQKTRSGLRRTAAGAYRMPHGELDLGSVAHRVDDNNSRDRHSGFGFRGPPHPNSDARRGHAVASVDHLDSRNRRCRIALGCVARDRSWYLGNGILVAWRAPLTSRGPTLLCGLHYYSGCFRADAGTWLANDGRVRSRRRDVRRSIERDKNR